MTSRHFEEKIAFVTGATSGIGRGVALAFAREGATVIGCGRNSARGVETQRLVEAEGGDFLFLPVDLGVEAQVTGAVRTALDRYGRVDCAANCAGVDMSAGFLDYTAAPPFTVCAKASRSASASSGLPRSTWINALTSASVSFLLRAATGQCW